MAFFLIASILIFVMHVIVGLWFYFAFPSIGWKIPALLMPLIMTAFVRWAMIYTHAHYGTLQSILYYVAYIWVGLLFIFTVIIIGFALLQAILSLFHIPSRFALGIISIVVLALAAGSAVWGGLSEPKIKHIYVTVPGAPTMTLAILSDSHLGVGVSLERFQKALDRLQAEKPDALFVLGDVFEYGMNRDQYAKAIADFQTPYGTYGVLGNHEYYMGLQNSINFYKKANIKLLQNSIIRMPNGVPIIGIDDIKTAPITEEQLSKILAQTKSLSSRIVLTHQPLMTEVIAKHNIPLMLSGHTHAGQIWPFTYLVKWKYPYFHGLYKIGPDSQLYVTSGMFYWGMPLRLFAPAELPILHIQSNE